MRSVLCGAAIVAVAGFAHGETCPGIQRASQLISTGNLPDAETELVACKGDPEAALAVVWNRLGKAYRKQGYTDKAAAAYEMLAEFSKKVWGPDNINLAIAYQNRAAVANDLGQPQKAEELALAAKSTFEASQANNPRIFGEILNTLALAAEYQAQNENAERYYRQALEQFEKTEESTHPPAILNTLVNYGVFLAGLGKTEAARQVLDRARTIAAETAGAGSDTYASVLMATSQLKFLQREYSSAEEDARTAKAIALEKLGPAHPSTLRASLILATALIARNNVAEAEPMLRDTLAGLYKLTPLPSQLTAGALSNLGRIYASRNEWSEAESAYSRSRSLLEKGYGPDHPQVIAITRELAQVMIQRGDLAEARRYAEMALASARLTYGDSSVEVASTKATLADVCRYEKRYVDALALTQAAIDTVKTAKGASDPEVAALLVNQARTYLARGKKSLAETNYQQAFDIWSARAQTDPDFRVAQDEYRKYFKDR